MRSNELGPVYGVPLIDTLPLGSGGMKQQMRVATTLSSSARKTRESRLGTKCYWLTTEKRSRL